MVNMRQFPTIDLAATGKQILRLRKSKNLTVKDLQDFFGFEAPQAIYKWQRGETLPSVDNLYALSKLLDVPVNDILVGNIKTQKKESERQSSDSFLLFS